MRKNFWPNALHATRFGLLAAFVGAAVVACGGGGNNSAPTQLQANAKTSWEVMTAGDIAQCNLRPSGDTNANKTALLVER